MKDPCVIYYGQIRMVSSVHRALARCGLCQKGSACPGSFHEKDNRLTADIQGWGMSPRGAGFLFGTDVVEVS
jgi:hypothetical protein